MNTGIETPAPGTTALLIIDMINDLDFTGGKRMRRSVAAVAKAILRLRDEADALGVPVVYVNDNYGHWHSERSRIVEHCMRDGSPGREIVASVQPRPDDYFVIKSQFSGFYASALSVLLPKLHVNRLILTGVAGDICVLFTAADAHMREYGLWVPRDAVASGSKQRNEWALETMNNSMHAETRSTGELPLKAWVEDADRGRELMPEGVAREAAEAG